MKDGFCEDSMMTISQKRSMCAKSCDLCGNGHNTKPGCKDEKDKYKKLIFICLCHLTYYI